MNGVDYDSTPVADAGPDQTVDEDTTVILDGTGSFDPDIGDTVSYSWAQIAGPAVTLSENDTATTSFEAPIVAFDTALSFSLTVSDGQFNYTDTADIMIINIAGGYEYAPAYNLTGTQFFDVPSNSSLKIQKFSVAAWFKTSAVFTSDAVIVNKGGFGPETAGQNLNYGIWIDQNGRLNGGFESQQNNDVFVTTPDAYNDGYLHYAVLTFDNAPSNQVVKLYVDGEQVQSLITPRRPDATGDQPLRIGANSIAPDRYFVGEIDEVRIWNRDLTPNEISSQYFSSTFNLAGQVIHVNMADVPQANAGPIQTSMENLQKALSGIASFDPDNDPLTYSWTQLSGPTAIMQDANTPTALVTPPDVVGEESLIFQLTINDGLYSASDAVRVVAIDANIQNEIFKTPDYMNDIAAEIDNATTFVYAVVYYLEPYPTNDVVNALENAVNRGVDVRVMIANQTLELYPDADDVLSEKGIPYKVVANHVKVVVIDNKTMYTGSANWNKNGLERNWELTLKTNNPDTIAEAYEFLTVMWDTGNKVVRMNDYYYERFTNGVEFYDLLLDQVKNAESIKVLMFTVTYNFNDMESVDSKLLNEVKNAYNRGANLQIVMDDPRYYETYGGRQFFVQNNIPHKLDDKNIGFDQRMHTKVVLIDDKVLFIGSQNWKEVSLDSPQEASIITRNPQTISEFLTIFNDKWSLAVNPP
jgi:phosphatidylserine/phosphatidylglycerophosphate/cardiolipin synthase-like enzyme